MQEVFNPQVSPRNGSDIPYDMQYKGAGVPGMNKY
jgi:hypothetical protein